MRGERAPTELDWPVIHGSSPHARGTRCQPLVSRIRHRFIPACAGNAYRHSRLYDFRSVHPRMRGERTGSRKARLTHGGSSPHARGTPTYTYSYLYLLRFIPACAGNAARPGGLHGKVPVHPRMRGERLLLKVGGVERHGSSPHARGTRRAARRPVAAGRFIPACAGNAGACAWWRPPQPVHPRMRGERSPSEFPLSHRYGSSPHARGTHGCQQIDKGGRRFIPACAGNATSSAASRALASVHPRMRGERRLAERCSYTPDGSSPHARGTPSG